MRSALVSLLAAAILLPIAAAAERSHVVKGGESVSAIAKRYYGDYELAELLMRFNGRGSSVIRPGERLRIPICEVHRVGAGDTWSGLAQRYVGRASAWTTIAELNGRPQESPLQPGDEIVMPVLFAHELQRGESLGLLAERFYGNPKMGSLLQEFNRLEDPRKLSVGEKIEVPLVVFRAATKAASAAPPAKTERTATKPPPKQAAPKKATKTKAVPKQEPPAPRFTAPLRAARAAYDEGDYEAARERLEGLRETVVREGTSDDRTEFWRTLSFVYVAFDRSDDACAAYSELSKSVRSARLDPDRVSPKIRNTLARCR